MQNYYQQLFLLGKRLLLVMILMTLSRVIFYFFNFSLFSNLTIWQVVQHLFYGLRFDLSTIFLFNLPIILLSILPDVFLKWRWFHQFIKWFFISVNSSLIAFNLIDAKFYEFEGKRLTGDIFSKEWLGEDFVTLLPAFVRDYWYMIIVFSFFVFVFVKIYPEFRYIKSKDKSFTFIKSVKQAAIVFLILLFSLFSVRGGAQLKPLGVIAAARYTSPEYMGLILNSPFTIVKTLNKRLLPKTQYYTKTKLDSIYSPIHKIENTGGFNNKNVVIIILESFGREYSGFLNDTNGYTPNLDSIMQLGLTFTNAYANGRRSIEALPSIYSSLPSLMDRSLVNSQFVSNNIEGIGSILKKRGYVSSFFHGGKNGTMGFDNYTKLSGIKDYYGKNEYPFVNDYDGSWGVFDEPYLQYFADELSNMQEPFFTSIFTLSSHHPYKIPEKYTNKFPKGELVNLESIGYADYALGEFFKTASTKPWFNNTLFILTADHTAQAKEAYYKTKIGKYAVPLVFYAPGDASVSGVSDIVCQQADILPSVLDYLGYSQPFVAFGKSVFIKDSNRFVVNYISGVYQLINSKMAISFDGSDIINTKYFSNNAVYYEPKNKSDSNAVNDAEILLKGIIQQYNYRMNNNLLKAN